MEQAGQPFPTPEQEIAEESGRAGGALEGLEDRILCVLRLARVTA